MQPTLAAALLIMTLGTQTVLAEERLTPERVFASPDINGPSARGVQLAPDGSAVTYLKVSPSNLNVTDLWIADMDGTQPRRLVDGAALIPKEHTLSEDEKSRRERVGTQTHGVVDYEWDEQGRYLLVPVEGNLWICERASGTVRQLTHSAGDKVDAKLSPKGRYVSFVRDDNLFVTPAEGGVETALTEDGTDTASWATAEFIAQEEFDRFSGYWWSPDESRIALTHVDQSGVDLIDRPEIGPAGATIVRQHYPRAGRPNARVDLYVETIGTRTRTKVDLGPTADVYLAQVDWAQDGRTLYVQRLSRDQKQLDLLAIEPESGHARIVLTEKSPHWVSVTSDFRSLKTGGFLWSSERSGNRHLYLYGADGTLVRQLTRGDWPVDAVEGVDESAGLIFFGASKDSPIERRIYSVSMNEPADPVPLTKSGGWWTAAFAKNGGAFAGTYDDPATPPRTAIYSAQGRFVRWVEDNRLAEGHPFFPYVARLRQPNFGTIKARDGQDLWWSLRTPPDFDASRRYPVVVEVYGGPAATTVKRRWANPSDQILLDAGYILFSLDNRGTPNRSVAFETALDRQFGTVEVEDQLAGIAHLKSLPFVDPTRIGVTGWSNGGYLTLMLMTVPDSPFAAGLAGAPVTDWTLYDTGYTERYMGTPAENGAAYHASDIIPRLGHLRPNTLMIMHGMADDNVLFDHATRVFTALQSRTIPFEMMAYPGLRHRAGWTPENKLHRLRMTLDFFDRRLKPH